MINNHQYVLKMFLVIRSIAVTNSVIKPFIAIVIETIIDGYLEYLLNLSSR